jgi:alcohol dehydrogenase YqhD (iron-dependent ADH family)
MILLHGKVVAHRVIHYYWGGLSMNNFTFYSPTYFVFGRKTDNEAGHYVKRFGGSKVLIHYGGGSVKRTGLLDRVKESLNAEDIPFIELGGVKPNPRSGLVYEGIELCRREGVDFILAVGGGSTIDSSKAIAAGVKYNGDFWDLFSVKGTIKDALPVGTILTIAAAGSEGSSDVVITQEKGMYKRGASGEAIRPIFSILNPELTFTLPPAQTANGIADIMAHVFERYFTNTKDVEVTDRICEAVLLTMVKESPKVIENPCDYEARANIMWAGMVAHNNLCGVGREQDWSSHAMEHELSALYDVAHGAGLAVMFPAWMKYVMKQDVSRFAQIAVRLWGCSMDFANPEATALEGIHRLEAFWSSLGLPTNFAELGAKEEDIPYMVKNIGLKEGEHIGSFVPLYSEDIEKIYRLAL